MKKIEIEIPDGKVAKWVNGVLTLVDKEPQDITEHIKTFEDAVATLGNDNHAVIDYYNITDKTCAEDILAFAKLRVIIEALNEGWKPVFNDNEYHYYPWLYVYTKEEYEKLDEGEKTHCVPLRSLSNAYALGGLVYASACYAGSYLYACYGVRLALKTRELAEYCSRQFIDIWCDYLFG